MASCIMASKVQNEESWHDELHLEVGKKIYIYHEVMKILGHSN